MKRGQSYEIGFGSVEFRVRKRCQLADENGKRLTKELGYVHNP